MKLGSHSRPIRTASDNRRVGCEDSMTAIDSASGRSGYACKALSYTHSATVTRKVPRAWDGQGNTCLLGTKKMPCPRDTASFREGEPGDSRCMRKPLPGPILSRGPLRKSPAAHDRDHHFNAAVRTGWSQSAAVSVSSRLTVSEHPAMSSEVTKLPTRERAMHKPRFSSIRRAALYIR
jgi:hypothetical protein